MDQIFNIDLKLYLKYVKTLLLIINTFKSFLRRNKFNSKVKQIKKNYTLIENNIQFKNMYVFTYIIIFGCKEKYREGIR